MQHVADTAKCARIPGLVVASGPTRVQLGVASDGHIGARCKQNQHEQTRPRLGGADVAFSYGPKSAHKMLCSQDVNDDWEYIIIIQIILKNYDGMFMRA